MGLEDKSGDNVHYKNLNWISESMKLNLYPFLKNLISSEAVLDDSKYYCSNCIGTISSKFYIPYRFLVMKKDDDLLRCPLCNGEIYFDDKQILSTQTQKMPRPGSSKRSS